LITARREKPALAAGSGAVVPRPVIIPCMRARKPVRATRATCTTRKSTRPHARTKCSVRAVCCPPQADARNGKTETAAGDIPRPVHTMSGKTTKTTVA
jgi:hypothetical protein